MLMNSMFTMITTKLETTFWINLYEMFKLELIVCIISYNWLLPNNHINCSYSGAISLIWGFVYCISFKI
jgi:hypothetical protein